MPSAEPGPAEPGPAEPETDISIRRAGPDDLEAIVELAQAALGWDPTHPNLAFFRWKHLDNPAGPSPMWVASDDRGLVGVRVFLRWTFDGPDGRTRRAVRAVDTATLPRAQGRGIFSRLTRTAIDDLAVEGVDFVFNTPNEQSRPGYLKMGWQVVGRVPIAVRPRGARGLSAMAHARVPATKWSRPSPAGRPAGRVLAELADQDLTALSGAPMPSGRLGTHRAVSHLRWRYGFDPLHYRAVTAPGGPGQGLAVFRVRARGGATEAAVCEVLAPDDATRRQLLAQIAASTGADYLMTVTPPAAAPGRRLVPLPGQGPILTWRGLAADAAPLPLSGWDLSLGDIELF